MPPGFVWFYSPCFLFFFPPQLSKSKGILTHGKTIKCISWFVCNLEGQKSHEVKNKIFTYLFLHHLIRKDLLCASHCAGLRILKCSSCSQTLSFIQTTLFFSFFMAICWMSYRTRQNYLLIC